MNNRENNWQMQKKVVTSPPSGFGGKWSHCHSCDDVTAEP